MTDPTTQFNPYSPPAADSRSQGLSADTEFLVSDKCVLCSERLTFPAVCIHTAETTNLVRNEDLLKWTPSILKSLQGLLLVVVIILSLQLLSSLMMGFNQALPKPELPFGFLLIVAGTPLLLIIVVLVARHFTRTVSVVWYISQQLDERQRFSRRILMGVAILCGVSLTGAIIAGDLVNENWYMLAPWSALGAVAALSTRRRQIVPIFTGRHMDLNVIQGLSPEFLQHVLRLIEDSDD
jgi:hypothetical protein